MRWELLLAAVAKNGCRAAGMSCGSEEEPSPAFCCPVRAEAAPGAVLGPCKGLWSRCWRNHPAGDCSRGLQVVSEQPGWKKSGSPPSGSHAAALVMFSDEGLCS